MSQFVSLTESSAVFLQGGQAQPRGLAYSGCSFRQHTSDLYVGFEQVRFGVEISRTWQTLARADFA